MKNILPPGIYEQVISNGLARLLHALPEGRKDEGPIDAAEAPDILTDYLSAFLQRALKEIGEGKEAKEALPAQIALANGLLSFLQQKLWEAGPRLPDEAPDAPLIDAAGKQLLGITRENELPLKKNAHLPRPTTSLIETSLFTGARQEPSMFFELKKEIATSDRLDLLVSFIKWSGLVLILPELQAFTERGGKLRIIATSYMGARASRPLTPSRGSRAQKSKSPTTPKARACTPKPIFSAAAPASTPPISAPPTSPTRHSQAAWNGMSKSRIIPRPRR